MLPTIDAAGLLLLTESEPIQFLLMKHKNRWDLPKGHVESGEDLLSAAVRETQEETGISPKKIRVAAEFKYVIEYEVKGAKRGDYHKRVTYFLGYIAKATKIKLTEHIGYEWMDWPPTVSIQEETIDPLLESVVRFLKSQATPSVESATE